MRKPARQYPQPLDGMATQYITGMTDAVEPAAAKPGRARLIRNGYVRSGVTGLEVVGRPGFRQAGAQLGSAGVRTFQFIGQYTKASGTTFTIAICGGKFYTFNWGTRVWTETNSATDFSAKSITVSTTARFYSSVLADTIIFSDGTNVPWSWNGTAGGGTGAGLVKLTNCPALFGPTWINYAKYNGVKASDHSTFVWSEENDPTTGYEAGGFNNAWNPLGASGFTGGAATNDAMYVFQGRRVIRIEGAVSTDFKTAGTRSDVSEVVGSLTAPLVTDAGVVFLDADAQPWLIPQGAGAKAVPFAQDCAVTTSTVARASLTKSILVFDPQTNLLLIGVPGSGQTNVSVWLAFRMPFKADDPGLPDFTGVWTGMPADAAGMVLDGNGVPTLMHAGVGDGYVYDHGTPDGSLWNDGLNAGTVPVDHYIIPTALGLSRREEKLVDRVDLILDSPTGMACTLKATTPYGTSAAQTFTVTAGGDRLGIDFILGTSTLSGGAREFKQTVGRADIGRWVEYELGHSTLSEQFGFVSLEAEAYAIGDEPPAP